MLNGWVTGHYKSPELEVGSWVHACSGAQLCPTLCDLVDCSLPGSPVLGIFVGENAGVGCHFLIQGWNSGLFHLLHWQVDSLPLYHLGSEKGFLGGGPEKVCILFCPSSLQAYFFQPRFPDSLTALSYCPHLEK